MVITYIDGEKVVHERPAKYQVKMKVPGPSLVNARAIARQIDAIDTEELEYYWGKAISKESKVDQWLSLVEPYAKKSLKDNPLNVGEMVRRILSN